MGVKDGVWGGIQIRGRYVKHGVLFKRFLYVVIIAVVMTALLTTLLYTFISRSAFTSIKEAEMMPRADALADLIGALDAVGGASIPEILDLLDDNDDGASLIGAWLVISDADGHVRFASDSINIGLGDTREIMREISLRVIDGENVTTSSIPGLRDNNVALVSAPIKTGGAVLMFVPMYETIVAMDSLTGTLIISLLLSLPLVVVLVYYAIGLIVRPLRQMRDVALSMSAGSFSARADEGQRGEIGELARSLNHLSRALGQTLTELTLERNRLRQMVDGLTEGLVAVDHKNGLTHGNPAIARLFSALSADRRSDKLKLIPLESVWADFASVLASGERIERALALPDRIIRMSIEPLKDMRSEAVGAVGLFQDITESERLERTRRDYVANVSHEMRTPLTAMRGLIEPLSDGMVTHDETRQRYYSILMRETMRLSRLIDDLMALSRLQSGSVEIDEHEVDVNLLLEDVKNKYIQPMEEHGLAFELFAEGGIRALSNADRVEQVLVILLDNAMKYTPEGGRVTIRAAVGDKITLSVEDTGVGISRADQPSIFDRFYKVDKAHSGLGSGLGLSIAKEMLRLMGEDIWVESEEGEGSRFYFTLKRGLDILC